MKTLKPLAYSLVVLHRITAGLKNSKLSAGAVTLLVSAMLLAALAFIPSRIAEATRAKDMGKQKATPASRPAGPSQVMVGSSGGGGVYQPRKVEAKTFAPINVREAAEQEALAPSEIAPTEIKAIDPPKGRPDWFAHRGRPAPLEETAPRKVDGPTPNPPVPSAQGSSPGPSKTFPGEFLTGGTIPPDTMGAIGTNHAVTVSNNEMNFRTREGVLISRLSLNAFWSSVVLEGGATPSTFDPKIYYDRFADKYFFFTSANAVSLASSVLFAVTQTNDPTGTWDRYVFDADPTATAASGRWADYPTVGFNKNWIVANYNVFNYSGATTTGYYGPYVYVIPKNDAYDSGTLTTTSLFQEAITACTGTGETILGCGFTMAPAVVEDNTTETEYLVEDWTSTDGQLRLSKVTGTQAAPVLTVGTQIPQAPFGWRFNAARINITGGYVPQRDSVAYAVSTQRVMANDSRINNSVLRNGSLWTSHHIMVAATPSAVPATFGVANPDIRTAVQWWQIDPTIEPAVLVDPITGLGTSPTQRGRIEDPLADNCNSGSSISVSTERVGCPGQTGQFFFFAGIAVNQNNDVLVGFTQASPLTYLSGAYAMRLAADPPNTMRDVVVFRSGGSNYNIGAGTGNTTARQNRWGDYSASMVDPINDIDFWTMQEYSDTRTALPGLGGAIAAPWATWWGLVKPNSTQPTTTGNLIISEFRLRGPQGINDEFIELYNPSATTPHRVASVDNSQGWALAWNNGTTTTPLTVVPEGVVVPPRGHYLIANSPVSTAAGAETLYYGLRLYPGASALPSTITVGGIRSAAADTGYTASAAAGSGASVDAVLDNAGVALFKSSTAAAFTAPNQADAAGFAGGGTTFFEGTGIPPITAGAVTGQISFHRKQPLGTPQDTGNNANDFVFTNTLATTEPLGAAPRMGAPGPENVDAPLNNGANSIGIPVFDTAFAASAAPNFVFDPTPVANGTAGTITVRRRLVNNTGAPLSRVRLRFVDISTFPQPVGTADLRVLNSATLTVETPPTQPQGGGLNSSVTPPIVTFATPLAAGANAPIDFVFGVMQTGCFRFNVIAEIPGGSSSTFGFVGTAGPAAGCAPTAAPASISGRLTTPDGASLGGVTMSLSGGASRTTISDSNGNYRFDNVDTNSFYTVTPSLVNYHFSPESQSFSLLGNKTDAVFTATRNAVISGNAIDTPDYFVRQHYLDFLGREPDQSGFEFWSDQIRSCGTDAGCRERRTINVSAAYFLSIEFTSTGGLVDRLYRASYGRRAQFTEFMPDQAQVAQGVRVGDVGWAALLSTNKEAFVNAWVQRGAFVAAYGGLANDAYVNALIGHTGVSFSADERAALVSGLNSGTLTRATALRQITEDDRFIAAKRNEAFVMMQYFGYLRRDPDESGYQFWLNKLNQFGGNFEQAEMVKAFIVSGEYRARFGQ